MRNARRFKVYDLSALRGKVPSILLDNYLDDTENIELISFIAGLHLSCGDFEMGIKICEDIAEKAHMGKENTKETGIGVWNLYILSKIYIEQEKFDKAYKALDTAEKYWSKDLSLEDSVGVYRVRDIEDLWLRKAFAYLLQGRKNDFESIIDRVMLSRYQLYAKAYEITGEVPIRDSCLLDCFEYSSYMCRNMEDLKHAIIFIRTAIKYLGKVPIDNNYLEGKISERHGELKNAYTYYLRFYLSNRPQTYYKTLSYGTCKCCAYFQTDNGVNGECKKHNIQSDEHKSCSKFIPLQIKP